MSLCEAYRRHPGDHVVGRDVHYRLSESQISRAGISAWEVYAIYGRCDCGEIELRNTIAWFVNREDAARFAEEKEAA